MILRIMKIYCQKYLAPHSSLRQGMNVDYFWGENEKKHFIFDFGETRLITNEILSLLYH